MIQSITLKPKACNSKIANENNNSKSANVINFKNCYFCDKVSFTSQVKLIPFNEFITKTIGSLSLEDVKKIETQAHKILKTSNKEEDLISLIKKKNDAFFKIFDDLNIKYEKDKNALNVEDDQQNLDKNARKKIKEAYIEILMPTKSFTYVRNDDPLLIKPSLNDWFANVPYKSKLPNLNNSRFVHPVEKAQSFIPSLTKQEEIELEKKVNALLKKKINPVKLEKNKEKALIKINQIIESNFLLNNGYFTSTQLKQLKKYVKEYTTYKKALGNNEIFTKEVESVVLNSTKKLSTAKEGDFINDLGLVVQKTTVFDKNKKQNVPCVILFNKQKFDHSFKLIKIDEDYEQRVINFNKKYTEIKNSDIKSQIIDLSEEAKAIMETEKEMNVAKVHFNVVPIENLRAFLKDMNQPQKVESLIENIKAQNPNANKVTLVVDFINPEAKRYYEGGRKVVLPLIHLLQEHNCNNIVMRASAIGENKKAPVPLYLRAGFKPLSHSEEEINKAMENHQFWDPKIPVFMYLPNDSLVNEIVKQQQPLQYLFKTK